MVRLEIYRLDPILQLTVCAFPSPISCRPHVRHPRTTTVPWLEPVRRSQPPGAFISAPHILSIGYRNRSRSRSCLSSKVRNTLSAYSVSTLKDQFRQGQVRHQNSSLAGR